MICQAGHEWKLHYLPVLFVWIVNFRGIPFFSLPRLLVTMLGAQETSLNSGCSYFLLAHLTIALLLLSFFFFFLFPTKTMRWKCQQYGICLASYVIIGL